MPIFDEYGLKEMMPLKLEEPDDGCLRPSIQNQKFSILFIPFFESMLNFLDG